MSKVSEATDRLCDKGIVAIVRARSSGQLIDVARGLLAGGVDCIEITMTTPNALEVIRQCRKSVAGAMIGVGSVLDPATTAAAWIASGAKTLGVGTALVTNKALAEGDFGQIESLARRYVRIVAEARAKKAG